MNGRILSAVLMVLIMLVASFAAGPALSGEHPWDSDRGGGDDKDDGDDGDWKYDTIIVPEDSLLVESAPVAPTRPVVFWYGWFARLSWGLSVGF